ncbi:uncharacterized protein LOC121998345 [Zingiber officinale]|uniref:Uncharacterized protein n=1 Tax=Zingiber officinale TaxID=94328 RepID=A0A8J5GE70_ZINOF|nr:uncharacterized protein LOC121998345 [Zingiber officinale]KAG6501922.1 hypothetical protein ZIOFF_041806 [Zingiber officinale]
MAFLLPLTDASANPVVKPRPFRWTISGAVDSRKRTPAWCSARGLVKDEALGRVIRVCDPLCGAGGSFVLSPILSFPLLGSASPSSPPSPSLKPQQERDEEEEKQRYYVNMGYAIRSLREDCPDIFQREPNFSIYRDDIVFKDPLNSFVGIDNYKRIFWAIRFTGRVLFRALSINIVSIWQPAENVIMVRWIVHSVPRVPWESHGRFDGNSEYKLDKNGKIYEHRVDNVALNTPTKFRVLPVEKLIQLLGCPSTPKPTYFETSLSNGISCLPLLFRFSWIRSYLALHLVFAYICAAKG